MQPFKEGEPVGPPMPLDTRKMKRMLATGRADVFEVFLAEGSIERQERYDEQQRLRKTIEALAKQHSCKQNG